MNKNKKDLLAHIWVNLCNYFSCEECPFREDDELCYDSQTYDYNKFANFINNLKIKA